MKTTIKRIFRVKKVTAKVNSAYERGNKATNGNLDIIKLTFQRFIKARAPEAAAGLAYYAIFSLFPLLLVLVAISSHFLAREFDQQQLLDYALNVIPVSREILSSNIALVLRLRGAFSIIGLVALLWSSTGYFSILIKNINHAWPEAELPNFVGMRLIALGIVACIGVLFFLSLVTTTLLDFLAQYRTSIWGAIFFYEMPPWSFLSNLLPFIFRLLLFWGLYFWIPNTKVRRGAAFWGALFTAITWELITNIFTWVLSSGFARYELIYGSLGAIVALMFWIYMTSWIIIFGAHLSASIQQIKKVKADKRVLENTKS